MNANISITSEDIRFSIIILSNWLCLFSSHCKSSASSKLSTASARRSGNSGRRSGLKWHEVQYRSTWRISSSSGRSPHAILSHMARSTTVIINIGAHSALRKAVAKLATLSTSS